MSAITVVLSAAKEKRSGKKKPGDDEKEQAHSQNRRICQCLYSNYDERCKFVIVSGHSTGDHELFLNALGPGARKAPEGFTFHKNGCK